MKLYFVTGNKTKFEEVRAMVSNVEQVDIDLPEIQEIDAREIIRFKLQEALKRAEGSFIVEDTSLYMDCLNGLPGPLVKWFLKTSHPDPQRRQHNLEPRNLNRPGNHPHPLCCLIP